MHPNITASFLKCFISLEFVSRGDVDVKKILLQKRRRKSYGNKNRLRESYVQANDGPGLWSRFKRKKPNSNLFFVPSVSFLVKSPYIIFSISTSRSPVMLRFKIVMFLNL